MSSTATHIGHNAAVTLQPSQKIATLIVKCESLDASFASARVATTELLQVICSDTEVDFASVLPVMLAIDAEGLSFGHRQQRVMLFGSARFDTLQLKLGTTLQRKQSL